MDFYYTPHQTTKLDSSLEALTGFTNKPCAEYSIFVALELCPSAHLLLSTVSSNCDSCFFLASMAEPPQIPLLVPMMVLDQNGAVKTVYVPQFLVTPTVGAPRILPSASQPLATPSVNPCVEPPKVTPKSPTQPAQQPPQEIQRIPKTGTKLYVSNLPACMKDCDFKSLFSVYGTIIWARLVKRRRTRTFGFVQFTSKGVFQLASLLSY